jgi:MFS family permease
LTAARRRTAFPPLLRDVVFRRYWTAHTISLFGDQVSLLALPLVGVLALDASAAEMGYLTAAGWLPYLLFALHAGAWVDRRGKRRSTMIAADLGRALLLASIPLAYAADALSLPHLCTVAFGVGAVSVLFNVADTSLFVSIVARERYVAANSLLNGSRAFSFVAGPGLSGALVQVLTAPVTLLLDALSFVASAVLLGRIAPREISSDPEGGGVLTGLRYIAGSAVMRSSLLATATINFFNFVFWALFLLFATRELGVSPGTLGIVLGVAAVGGLVGSVVTTPVTRRIGVGPTFVVGCVVFPAPLVLVPLAGGSDPLVLALLFLAEFGSGLGVMMLDISAGSIFAAVIPHRLRSRVSGAYTFANYGVRVGGSLLGGVLGSTIGLRPALWVATVGALAGVLFLIPSPVPRLRDLPEPDDVGASPESADSGRASP